MEVHKINITKEHCPMTFVKTKLALEKLKAGERLEVLLKAGEPLKNVPKTAEEQGYAVLDIKDIGDDVFEVVIEK